MCVSVYTYSLTNLFPLGKKNKINYNSNCFYPMNAKSKAPRKGTDSSYSIFERSQLVSELVLPLQVTRNRSEKRNREQ